jgi:NADH pyrophosphatase NudC (nudix superfamily)
VTGFLEAGEMPEDGIVREVKEEIGLDAQLHSYIGMYEFFRKNQLLICYHLTVDSGDVRCPPDEIADYRWVPVESVQPWTAGTGHALRDWLRSRGIERDMVEFGRHT